MGWRALIFAPPDKIFLTPDRRYALMSERGLNEDRRNIDVPR